MIGRRVKKFYKSVSVEPREDAFAILLDGRPAKTPARADLAAPTSALAGAIADEWRGVGDSVDFNELALTRLATTAIDLGNRDRKRWIEDVVAYLNSDLLCYRAARPAALAGRQDGTWSPYLAWAEQALGAALCVTVGVTQVAQPDDAALGARQRLSAMNDWTLIGVKTATEIAGSAVLALALEARAFPAADIFSASRLDERFQAEQWGVDEEAAAREARLQADFLSVAKWLDLLNPTA